MAAWTRVKWTEAGQVIRILGWKESSETETMPPAAFYGALRESGRLAHAISFLALALPRFDAVSWAVRFVRDCEPLAIEDSVEGLALRAALIWLQNPDDDRRYKAMAAARKCSGAEALAAWSVFFSGGSIAPLNCEPVPAPPHTAGKFAGAAVRLACGRSENRNRALRTALDAGEELTGERTHTQVPS